EAARPRRAARQQRAVDVRQHREGLLVVRAWEEGEEGPAAPEPPFLVLSVLHGHEGGPTRGEQRHFDEFVAGTATSGQSPSRHAIGVPVNFFMPSDRADSDRL
ncbi:hypothetical protein THAOC_20269, partial [Thalassiosira oceanica]